MPEPLHNNLLTEPILKVDLPDGSRVGLSLPAVFSRLASGTALEFAALQAHQQHAWHAFLVQLAAIALQREGLTAPVLSEERWRTLLRSLTAGSDDPFCLVVENLARPAFMQPPVPEGRLDAFKDEAPHPDELDLLITSKNHDVKVSRMAWARPEHWVYTLVSLQTMQGYSGRTNYGISRMNGGMGNRPCVTAARDLSWSARLFRDVQVWLERREGLLASPGYTGDGPALLWLEPWDGHSSIDLHACDPFYIEVCRRVRLFTKDGAVAACYVGTKDCRIADGDAKGDTGDIWTPVDSSRKVFTAAPSGLTYSVMQRLMVGTDYSDMPAAELRAEDGDTPVFLVKVMVRGQGKTEGLHERVIPIPAKVRRLLGKSGSAERNRVGSLALDRVKTADTIRKGILYPAVVALLNAGEEATRGKSKRDDRPGVWTTAFDRQVDHIFFESLWGAVDRPVSEANVARQEWETELLKRARTILEEAIATVPIPMMRRYQAITASERLFYGCKRKHFPDVTQPGGSPDGHI